MAQNKKHSIQMQETLREFDMKHSNKMLRIMMIQMN